MACGDATSCTTATVASDCQTCQGVCNDGSAYCQADTDCAASVGCGAHACGDGSACASATDCAAKTCTPFSFWETFASHLDKSRAGCTIK